MRYRLALLPAPLGLLFAGSAAVAQGHDYAVRVAELEQVIPALMDSGGVTGMAMALVVDGEVTWARGFGLRSSETREPVDTLTVFEAASLSKPVFTYGVLTLVERGELDLDKPLAEYLPYEDIEHDERYKRITARMVLSHTTGFPNWRPRGGQLEIDFDPGSRFRYSGEGFVYLQRVVEHLTGVPMPEFMTRGVLEPLDMTRSSYVWQERFAENVAVGHRENGSARNKNKPRAGNVAWSLQTTAPDFARFLSAIVKEEGLTHETIRAMLSPQSQVEEGVTWGLGWGLQDTDAGRGFWHWGHNSGYRAYTLMYPEQGFGMIMFINSDNGMLILEAVLAQVFGGDHPAAAWLDYETHHSPQRVVRTELERTIREQGVEVGLARYQELKGEYPDEAFEEDMLNILGYRLMRGDLLEAAIEIFRLNVAMYPDAFNTYDSLGEAYMEHGDIALAITNYEKSVELNPDNTNGIRMLEKLRKQLKEK